MSSTPPDEQSLLGRLTNIFGGSPTNLPKPDQDEEEGMARMSFLGHLEELRHRLIMIVYGLAGAFCLALLFRNQMWDIVSAPAVVALTNLHVKPPELIMIGAMDVFQIVWMKLPLVVALFVASPWILYQVWAFIAPGLYKHERRWAIPFVASSAGLFILGGLFAYFVIFRFGLEFLLGLGIGHGIHPTVSVTEYFDLFVDVMLAVGIVFEIPVLLFLLTLIRVVSPRFLIKHSRYAIMIIVVLAAVITPTGDVFNLTLFATPMILLFYVGVFASYVLVLKREEKKFPWAKFITWVLVVLVILALISWGTAQYFGYRFVMHSPFLVR